MIFTTIYQESGFSNQIWKAMTLRAIAKKQGYNFHIIGEDVYKGKNIIDLDFGKVGFEEGDFSYSGSYQEKLVRNSIGVDISPADPFILDIPDHFHIDGNLQAVSYIKDYKTDIIEWLNIKPEKENYEFSHDNICLLHLRGGDHIGAPANSFLGKNYYANAMKYMTHINPAMHFYLLSDDIRVAQDYAHSLGISLAGSLVTGEPDPYKSDYHLGGDISIDWAILNSAKNVILSNSTFAFWPVWTNKNNPNVVAPWKYMNFNNSDDNWSTGDMHVDEWNYIDNKANFYEKKNL